MAPNRDQLCAMSRKEKETLKEYTQRWHGIVAHVSPTLEEKEITKLFLKNLSMFYYDHMVASAPSDFTEMVNMGLRLEEGVCEGRLKEGSSSNGSRKYENGLPKKKEHDANTISQERRRRLPRTSQCHQHVAFVTPVITSSPVAQAAPSYQSHFQQCVNQQNQQNRTQRHVQFCHTPILPLSFIAS